MPKHMSVDKPIDSHLKPLKDADGTPCALELSTDKARVKSLEVLGEAKGQTPTTGAGLATKQYVDDNAGGTAYWIQVWNARAYTRNLDWFHPHHQYGVAYYNWTYDTNSTSLPSTLTDDKHPLIVVPKNCTLTEYNFTGSFTGAQTYEVALMKGTGVTFGSAGNWSLSQVGATQSQVVGTANVQHTLGQEGLSVSLSKGDTLVPVVRRSTTDTSALHFFELAFSIVCEVG